MNALSNFRWSFLSKLIGLMFVYTLIGYYSLTGFSNPSHLNMVSLINGIALAVHIIGGKKFLPSLFVALLASGLWANHSMALGLLYALSYTVANFAGFKLFRHYCPQNYLDTPQNFLRLGLSIAFSAIISAGIGMVGAWWLDITVITRQTSMLSWWQNDTLSLLLTSPLILIWYQKPKHLIDYRWLIEFSVCLLLALLTCQQLFFNHFNDNDLHAFAKPYLLLVYVIWSAIRCGRHATSLLLAVIAGHALLAQFYVENLSATLQAQQTIDAWSFLTVLIFIGLFLALLVNQHKKSEQELALLSFGMNHMKDAAYLINEKAELIYVNQQLCEALKYSKDELLSLSVSDIDPIYPVSLWQENWHLLKEHHSIKFESVHRTCEQQIFPVEISYNYFEYQGKGYNLALARDISDIKRNQQRERSRNRVLELLTEGATMRDVLDVIVRSVEQENRELRCSILLMANDGKHLLHGVAPSLPDFYNQVVHNLAIGPGKGACGTSAYTGRRTITENIQTSPDWEEFKELALRASLASCWSEPIISQSGRILGTFAIYNHKPKVPNDAEIQLITGASHLASIAIERSQINEELQLATLVYQNTSEGMVITDADGKILNTNPAYTLLTGIPKEAITGEHFCRLNPGYQNNPGYQAIWQEFIESGQWQGELWNRRKNGEIYAEWLTINTVYDEDKQPHRRVALISDVSKLKESKELIWRQANFDPLTGLPNRRMFHERLQQEMKEATRSGKSLALLFIDLDHFKEVNDTLGHSMGDELLKEAAKRLTNSIRDTDTVSRLGGDEFTIILNKIDKPGCIERIAQNILAKLAEPFILGIDTAYVTGSIGITVYPTDAQDQESLIKNADQAMYAAKEHGRNHFHFFTLAMQEVAQNRMRLANDLRRAMAEKQLMVVYQPIVELSTGQIHKAEALIRWQHPQRGLIDPKDFLPIAEDTGVMTPISHWVFNEAALQVKHWQTSFNRPFQITLNLSSSQFRNNEDSYQRWLDLITELQLPKNSLAIEISESLLMDTRRTVSKQLLKLRDSGIQVAIDGFGTGYSSLSFIKKFAIDYIKIDQSFVRNLDSQAGDLPLCEAIIAMAHKLNIKVIAEGIETEQQRRILSVAGCDYGQGFLFSRPLPVYDFGSLLVQNHLKQSVVNV